MIFVRSPDNLPIYWRSTLVSYVYLLNDPIFKKYDGNNLLVSAHLLT